MDFIAANFHIPEDALLQAYRVCCGVESEVPKALSGNRLSLCFSASRYFGLSPLIDTQEVVLVCGDPLNIAAEDHAAPDPSSQADTYRTGIIARLWRNYTREFATLRPPHHPGLMFRANRVTGVMEAIQDHGAFVPLFSFADERGWIVATSADLIAALVATRFDDLSAYEKLCTGQISFPHTLYAEVKQVLPAASVVFDRDTPAASTCWWTPPVQTSTGSQSIADLHTLLRQECRLFLDKISRNLGHQGYMTLSAGSDTRFLADCVAEHGSLDVTALCCTAAENFESWTARLVAEAAGLPFRHIQRQMDHHAAIALDPPLLLGTHSIWSHAHFHHLGLGPLPDARFLVGGYMSDTFLSDGDIYTTAKKKLPAPASESAAWAITPIVESLCPATRSAIQSRRDEAKASLQLGTGHSAVLREIWPFSSQLSGAHFSALRRNYPAYEFFMTRPVVELGFRMPQEIKTSTNKREILRPLHDSVTRIPINPSSNPDVRKAMSLIKKVFPKDLWPPHVAHPGPWSEPSGPSTIELGERIDRSISTVGQHLGIPISSSDQNSRCCYEIEQAFRLARTS